MLPYKGTSRLQINYQGSGQSILTSYQVMLEGSQMVCLNRRGCIHLVLEVEVPAGEAEAEGTGGAGLRAHTEADGPSSAAALASFLQDDLLPLLLLPPPGAANCEFTEKHAEVVPVSSSGCLHQVLHP